MARGESIAQFIAFMRQIGILVKYLNDGCRGEFHIGVVAIGHLIDKDVIVPEFEVEGARESFVFEEQRTPIGKIMTNSAERTSGYSP